MSKPAPAQVKGKNYLRPALILLIIAFAFAASYQLASALGGGRHAAAPVAPTTTRGSVTSPSAAPSGSTAGGGTALVPAGGCCGGGPAAGTTFEGTAEIAGGIQRITVDTSSGYYQPNYITLAAGVPAEITFKQASGCLSEVLSQGLRFDEDLTRGDKTVQIDGALLKPGTYSFSCGMGMVFGTIIVK